MDFELKDTPEMAKFRQEVKTYLKDIIPTDKLINSAYFEDDNHEQYLLRRAIGSKLGEKGWLYPWVPKEYGGAALSGDEIIVLTEEMEEYDLGIVPYGDAGGSQMVPPLLVWGTEEQKRQFIPPTAKGEKMTWLLLTEPHGGSDLASAKTTAIRDGDEYVVNGTKTWVGDKHYPEQFWTIVMTDPNAPRHQNLGFIVIPSDLKGITSQPLYVLNNQVKNSVFFEDVRVPAANLIGGENNGWKVANTVMEVEHAGAHVGKNKTLERLIHHIKTTSFNGQSLAKDQDIRDILADLYIEADVERLFGLRNFWMRHSKRPLGYEGSQSVYHRKMSELRNAGRVQQILGYFAVTQDKEWTAANGYMDTFLRDAVVRMHPGGTQDIHRTIIARRMGIGRTVKEEAARIE